MKYIWLLAIGTLLTLQLHFNATTARAGVTRTVKFAPGSRGTVIYGAVIRGERDRYYLGASAGQTMCVSLKSVESNAVFDVYAPGGKTLASGSTRWSGVLPRSGKYAIEIGGTRGNASYNLSVTIR